MPDANELLRINLHEVTSERDPEKRRAATERAYVEDLRFLDSEAELVGRQAFSDGVQKIDRDRDRRKDLPRLTHPAGRPASVLGWVPLGIGVGVVALLGLAQLDRSRRVVQRMLHECSAALGGHSGAALHRSSKSLGSGEDLSLSWRRLAADRPPVPLTRR